MSKIEINIAQELNGKESYMAAILVDSQKNLLVVPMAFDDMPGRYGFIKAVDYYVICDYCHLPILDANSGSYGRDKTICDVCRNKPNTCKAANHDACMECHHDDCCTHQENGFMQKPFDNRIALARLDAQTAFWGEVMKHFPEITSGDFLMSEIDDTMETWIKHWVELNTPEPITEMQYTITFMHDSSLKGVYEFGTFTGKFNQHSDMLETAQSMIKNFKTIHGGEWDFSWTSKPYVKPVTKGAI